MTNATYFARSKLEAEHIASGPVVVAHLAEEPWLILGWLAYEPQPAALVYAYTRFSFRRQGVFDLLMRWLNPCPEAPFPCRYSGRCLPALRDRYNLTFEPR